MSNALLHITLASHNFKVTKLTPRGNYVVNEFASKYVLKGFTRLPNGRYICESLKVFAAATKDRAEYRFHINQYKDFLDHIKYHHITESLYTVETLPIVPGLDINVTVKPEWKIREDQVPVIEYLKEENGNIAKFVDAQTGSGKAQPLTAKIKVPGGWSTMGEMYVGKEIIAKDGTISKVTGVFPQGEMQLYKITFADGRSTECCASHLWRVFYINTSVDKRWRVVNTLEILRLISFPNPRVYIDLIDNETTEDLDLPIDPYVLGLILGDGSISQNHISITKKDQFIFDEIRKILPDTLQLSLVNYKNRCLTYRIIKSDLSSFNNIYNEKLRDMGLMGKLSHEKFIPKQYLEGSYKQRLAILQGLLDTDGYCSAIDKGASIEFSSSSEQLALDFQYLIRSIGGIAKITSRNTHYVFENKRVEARINYRMTVRVKKPSSLFRLPRKKERTNDNSQYCENLKLRVTSVAPIDIREAQCISIDHPDRLYITDDFIVTHNTVMSLFSIADYNKRAIIIIKPMFIEKWVEDLEKTYKLSKGDVMVVKGSAHLIGLLDLAKNDELKAKFIIISNKTMQNWIKLYEQFRGGTIDLGYDTLPENLFQDLNAGIRLIDEVHMDLHLTFKIDLYTNVAKSISLSATLLSNDPFIAKMQECMYPTRLRYMQPKLNRYINSHVVYYQFKDPSKIRTTEYGATNYSHTALEKSIIKHIPTLNNYFNLIDYIMQIGFIKHTRKKKKLLIFAATVDMCTVIVNHFAKKYPQYNVKRYVAEDSYEDNLMGSDICVSTLGSSGTAVDIPNLTNVILTVAVDSIQSNIQALGRLRKLDNNDKVEFHYFACQDIPKHMEYAYRKQEMLEKRAATFSEVHSRHVV